MSSCIDDRHARSASDATATSLTRFAVSRLFATSLAMCECTSMRASALVIDAAASPAYESSCVQYAASASPSETELAPQSLAMSALAAASEVDVGVADAEFAGRCSHADVSFAKSELAAPVTVTGSVSAEEGAI